jgi:hypothetical protein
MVHGRMRNDSRLDDEVYMNRVQLTLEDFFFFSLYLFCSIAKQVATLKIISTLPLISLP